MKLIAARAKQFAGETRGNVAMLMAFSVIPLLGAAALALDYTNAETLKTKLAASADSAALAAAQMYGATEAQRIAKAQDSFNASVSKINLTDVTFTAGDVMTSSVYSGFRVEATARAPSILGSIFSYNALPLKVSAEASLGDVGKLELALVLDTTGSMEGAKLDALKVAAKNLVDNLSAKALTPGQIKYALVPFNQYVNVGIGNRGKSWLSVPTEQQSCYMTADVVSKTNCRMVTNTWNNDGTMVSYQTEQCDYIYGPQYQVCNMQVWRGCVGSRNYPLNVQDGSYSTTPVPGLLEEWCPGELVPLTQNTTTIKAAIDGMSAWGETYIPGGLAWGWRALSSGEPFDETGKGKSSAKLQQYLILMTDGANTLSPNYPDHWGNNTNLANTLTGELCTAIKNDQITVFTIAFDVTDTTIKNILQTCATKAENFFDASNAAQLSDAFSQIGRAITALRLKK